MKVLEAFAQFSRNYLMARLYSQKTIDGYWWVIKSFVESSGNIDTTLITKDSLSEWILYMDNKGNSRATIHTNVSRFRVFIEYLNLEGICFLGKEEVVAPRKPKSLPRFTTPQTIDRMIAAAPSIRDQAIISVLFSTALRNAEIRSLKRGDVIGRDVFVREGKGLKDRLVRLDNRSCELLGRYLSARTDQSPYLFISARKQPVAASTMRHIINQACELAGLPPTSPHPIRHGAATHMMNKGAHLRVIQDYLGHSDPKITELYTHVSHGDIIEVHAQVFDN